jgi:hypothetical protein
MIRTWGHICREDGTISHSQLVKLVRTLAPPIGTGPAVSSTEAEAHTERIAIVQVLRNRYTFEHTVWGLLATIAEVPVPDNHATAIVSRKIGQHFVAVYAKLGIVWDRPGEIAAHERFGVLKRACVHCCGWLPCMRRTKVADSTIDMEPSWLSRWSIFPSFAGAQLNSLQSSSRPRSPPTCPVEPPSTTCR